MKITRFEDLQAWQQARVLANLVYDATDQGNFARDFNLRDQIRGAVGSVMHNCAEAFDAGFDNEFVVFLKYALVPQARYNQKSIWLWIENMCESAFKHIYDKATEAKKIINALIDISEEARWEKLLIYSDQATIRLYDYEKIM